MNELKKYLLYSQLSLAVSLLICSLIKPGVIVHEGGVSNFGNYLSTFVLYTIGFVLNIIFIYLAGRSVIRLGDRYLGWALYFIGFITFLVLISTFPRHFSFTYSYIHDYLGIALFSYEFVFSVYMLIIKHTHHTIALMFVEMVGLFICLLSILKVADFLYIGQLVAFIGFALLLLLSFPPIVKIRLKRGASQKLF